MSVNGVVSNGLYSTVDDHSSEDARVTSLGGTTSSQDGTAIGVTSTSGAIYVDATSDSAINALKAGYQDYLAASSALDQASINSSSQLAKDVGSAIVNKSENTSQTIVRVIEFAIGAAVLAGIVYFLAKEGTA